MGPAVRFVRRIQIVMLVSIALYAVAGERFAAKITRDPANTLFHALSLVSISLVGATMVVRRTLVLPSETALKEDSDDHEAATRWSTGHLVLFGLCEMLGLFGLVLRLTGFSLAHVWGFYLGGFLLLLLYSPRAPQAN
jgi:hypothetical protein